MPITAPAHSIPVRVMATDVQSLGEAVQRAAPPVYALLDACDEPRVPPKVRELGQNAVSLYRGQAETDFWDLAPYVASVDKSLLDWILAELAGTPWGVFATADTDLAGLRRHFRRFLMVQAPDGRVLYFRFYDPRVLLPFLKTCTADEARAFFGPVTSYWLQDESGDWLQIQQRGIPSLRK